MNNYSKYFPKTFAVFALASLLFFALVPFHASASSETTQAKGDVTINFYTEPYQSDFDGTSGGKGEKTDSSTLLNPSGLNPGDMDNFGGEDVKGESVYIAEPGGKYPSTELPKTGSNYLLVGALVVMASASIIIYVLTNKRVDNLLKGGKS